MIEAGTVWLASYPKSGNTWVRAMLAALTAEGHDHELDINGLGGGPIASSRAHLESWIGFASGDLTRQELEYVRPRCDAALDLAFDEVRFRKIHDALRGPRAGHPIIPPERTKGAIYLLRDPRDIAVSYAHHNGQSHEWAVAHLRDPEAEMLGLPDFHGEQTPQHLGTWSEHVRGWMQHELFPVLLVRYEDIAADPLGELEKLARFAGIDAQPERLAAAVASATFDALREKEARNGFVERPGRARMFFRRGEVGAWREELAPGLAAEVERDHAEVMTRFGYTVDVRC